MLVSWDVIAMFPNIDNNLGISAVKNALDARTVKLPSSKCISEAVEICLKSNNCQVDGSNYLHQHGHSYGAKT